MGGTWRHYGISVAVIHIDVSNIENICCNCAHFGARYWGYHALIVDVEFICGSPKSYCDCIFKVGPRRGPFSKVKWGHKGRLLIWWEWCSYKKEDGTPDNGKDIVRRRLSVSQERVFTRNRILLAPSSWTFQPPEPGEKRFLLFKPTTRCMIFCYGSLSQLRQGQWLKMERK